MKKAKLIIFAMLLSLFMITACGDGDETTTDVADTAASFKIAVDASTCGSITLDPASDTYEAGTEVTVTAVADADCTFEGWTGDLSGTDNPATITVDADKTIGATFTAVAANTYVITVSATTCGTITLSPDQSTFDEGTSVTATAIADAGCDFDAWTGDLTGSTATNTFEIIADMTIGATFPRPPGLAADFDTTSGNSGEPGEMTLFQGKIYMSYYNATGEQDLYVYDGTSISLVNTAQSDIQPFNLTVFNDKLYFTATNGTDGYELWVYDGTTEPVMVYDLHPSGGWISNLFVWNDLLLFSADNGDGIVGEELYYYKGAISVGDAPTCIDINGSYQLDGTLISNNSADSNPGEFFIYSDTMLMMSAAGQPYTWNGPDLGPGIPMLVGGGSGAPVDFFSINYATGIDTDIYFSNGADLYEIDFSGAATASTVAGVSAIKYPVLWNGKIYGVTKFGLENEISVFDGTNSTKVDNADVNSGSEMSQPAELVVFDDKLYFFDIPETDNVAENIYLLHLDTATGTPARIDVGVDGSILRVVGDQLSWQGDIDGLGNDYEMFLLGK